MLLANDRLNWGTAGEWAGGIFTLLAVLAALWLARHEPRDSALSLSLANEALEFERDRRREELEFRRREQASHVAMIFLAIGVGLPVGEVRCSQRQPQRDL